jgi:putative tryptophan/tyrosine transport system substrate-binding protein
MMQFDQLKRREFITLLGGAVAWPLAGRAQEDGRTYRLGFLLPSARQTPAVEAFFDELRLNGFVEGKNLVVVPGFEATDNNLAERAAALVNAAPDAIVAGPAPPLRALQAVTRTIPLIGMSEDMVGEGLAASLARPGGNITGISCRLQSSCRSFQADRRTGSVVWWPSAFDHPSDNR